MAITRSAARAVPGTVQNTTTTARRTASTSSRKRNAADSEKKPTKKQKTGKAVSKNEDKKPSNVETPKIVTPIVAPVGNATAPTFLPAKLSFSYMEARNHLIDADPRFGDIFNKMKCRPFEHLERVDPFRTLTTSILGQQISWLAARSITHRFKRLYNPSLPEKPTDGHSSDDSFFPTAEQVCVTNTEALRTAGLSGRKAEYVLDLASRFADGRLSAAKILEASDEELAEMLIAVRGIGKWTVDMFAIFSLRRPDILPVGDLGVQRGVIRWFLSLHSPKHLFTISPKKLPRAPSESADIEDDTEMEPSTSNVKTPKRAVTPEASTVLPTNLVTPKRGVNNDDESDKEIATPSLPAPPQPFTPSINQTLNKSLPGEYTPPSLPAGLTVDILKSRLNGKNKVKGALLTPKEMEELTESWRPYRSLGVYYMWALAEDKSG